MARYSTSVLLVEDYPPMLRFIRRTLELDGFSVMTATDGPSALDLFEAGNAELVLLDAGIPEIDGLDVCHRLKEMRPVPVIMVTARGADDDVVRGFEAGADDYLAKPFAGRVLVARVRALLRRTQALQGGLNDPLRCGDLELDLEAHRITRDDRDIHLTPTEYKLFALLLQHQGKVLTSGNMISQVWGLGQDADSQILRTHIGRLRRKIEPDHANPTIVQTVSGVGYCLQCPPGAD